MDELRSFPGGLLVISHDLKLLDRSIDKVLHLADGRLHEYKGHLHRASGPSSPPSRSGRERAAGSSSGEIARLPRWPTPCGAAPTAGPGSPSRSTSGWSGSRARRTEIRAPGAQAARFALPEPRRSGEVPLAVRGLAVRYGPDTVLARRGLRAAPGRPGGGHRPQRRREVEPPAVPGRASRRRRPGDVGLGVNVAVGYFAQEHEQVDPAVSVLDNIDDAVLRTETERRALLGSFGLPAGAADQMPASLSGGERAKLGLAMLAAGHANLLVLDEPTNNLDPPSIERGGRDAVGLAGHAGGGQPRPGLRGGARPHPRAPPAVRAVRPLARGVPGRRGHALDMGAVGPLAFVGGDEWTEGCDFDAELLAASGGTEVLVLPTAAAYEHPERRCWLRPSGSSRSAAGSRA